MNDPYLPVEKEALFPNLRRGEYQVTSSESPDYNCIAHAAGKDDNWWWPDDEPAYWPDGLPKEETLEAFILAYESEGYSKSDPPNSELEAGFEKVAIYVDDKGVPTHAARQLANGEWTSKLGSWEDIQHKTLDAVEDSSGLGLAYGKVAVIMKRSIRVDMQS
jgi:hypothetical protein